MKRVGLVFPGQGSQYVGMGRSLYENFDEIKELFDLSEKVLDFPVKRLLFEGPEEELRKTYFAQPLILLVSYSAYKVLEKEISFEPYALSGHSLGEYTALLVSGFFTFEDSLRIVRKRGLLMEEAYPRGKGGMYALLSPDMDAIEKRLREITKNGHSVSFANFNSPEQVVISGEMMALEELISSLQGIGFKKAIRLNVSGPFHSPLMKEAAEKLLEELKRVKRGNLRYPVVFNVDASMEIDGDKVLEKLYLQMFSPVRWQDCVMRMVKEGVDLFLEVGPKNVLTNLIKRISPDVPCIPVEKKEDIERVKEMIL